MTSEEEYQNQIDSKERFIARLVVTLHGLKRQHNFLRAQIDDIERVLSNCNRSLQQQIEDHEEITAFRKRMNDIEDKIEEKLNKEKVTFNSYDSDLEDL